MQSIGPKDGYQSPAMVKPSSIAHISWVRRKRRTFFVGKFEGDFPILLVTEPN